MWGGSVFVGQTWDQYGVYSGSIQTECVSLTRVGKVINNGTLVVRPAVEIVPGKINSLIPNFVRNAVFEIVLGGGVVLPVSTVTPVLNIRSCVFVNVYGFPAILSHSSGGNHSITADSIVGVFARPDAKSPVLLSAAVVDDSWGAINVVAGNTVQDNVVAGSEGIGLVSAGERCDAAAFANSAWRISRDAIRGGVCAAPQEWWWGSWMRAVAGIADF
jgi:hypothetical protein